MSFGGTPKPPAAAKSEPAPTRVDTADARGAATDAERRRRQRAQTVLTRGMDMGGPRVMTTELLGR